MLVLYQMPISHFCEKARWALARKGVEYRTRNLLPGLHAIKAKKLTPKTSVPILVHGDKVVYESRRIISYLDREYPRELLTPEPEELRNQAMHWERFADTELGPHVRRLCYHTLLDHPDLVIPAFTDNGPWYGPALIKAIFPRLRARMRELMDINDETARQSEQTVRQAVDALHARLQDREYLVGDRFTRADLAAAALLAPFTKPEQYGIRWPATYPQPLQGIIDSYGGKLDWVVRMYAQHR